MTKKILVISTDISSFNFGNQNVQLSFKQHKWFREFVLCSVFGLWLFNCYLTMSLSIEGEYAVGGEMEGGAA